jgi:hypothetical protein
MESPFSVAYFDRVFGPIIVARAGRSYAGDVFAEGRKPAPLWADLAQGPGGRDFGTDAERSSSRFTPLDAGFTAEKRRPSDFFPGAREAP